MPSPAAPLTDPADGVAAPPPAPGAEQPSRRRRRAWLWSALVVLLVVAQSLLVGLTLNYESSRAQEQVDTTANALAIELRQLVNRDVQGLQALLWNDLTLTEWHNEARDLLRSRAELLRLERRDSHQHVIASVDTPFRTPLFALLSRKELDLEAELACTSAQRLAGPAFSRSYFVPVNNGYGVEVIDVCMPVLRNGQMEGFMVGSFALSALMSEVASTDLLRSHELTFVESDGTRLARAGLSRGAGVYVSERLIDLPGQTLQLRVDSRVGKPQLIPNLTVALVLGLSLALGAVVALLVRDVRRRAKAEQALAESLAFRKAMEDSLVTGLRARDLEGRISYVNPAFCQMVGFAPEDMIGRTLPPYWPPELAQEYLRRQALRLDISSPTSPGRRMASREGFETTFMHSGGERFSVLIFEAPLVNGAGQQTGWMSAVLDVSEQRRMEELSRQQQERLQATARLATVGEMASLLSHELNQPLSAIASYATGSLNLMQDGPQDEATRGLLRQATERIAEQAERAGRVIKSVHDFVRRREQAREPVRVEMLIDAVLPLVRLQARKSGTQVEVDSAAGLPRVVCDRTMVEQVLLNLTRNGIQAMEEHTPIARRELVIRVRSHHPRWVTFSVLDRGPGVSEEAARRMFTPFFTTRSEGMGLGLSLCRTVIEQHGGALDFENLAQCQTPQGIGPATEFRFTLEAEGQRSPPPRRPTRDDGHRSAPVATPPSPVSD